jgi:hypothetical protein
MIRYFFRIVVLSRWIECSNHRNGINPNEGAVYICMTDYMILINVNIKYGFRFAMDDKDEDWMLGIFQYFVAKFDKNVQSFARDEESV